jgi:hypothetical protein
MMQFGVPQLFVRAFGGVYEKAAAEYANPMATKIDDPNLARNPNGILVASGSALQSVAFNRHLIEVLKSKEVYKKGTLARKTYRATKGSRPKMKDALQRYQTKIKGFTCISSAKDDEDLNMFSKLFNEDPGLTNAELIDMPEDRKPVAEDVAKLERDKPAWEVGRRGERVISEHIEKLKRD